MTTKKPTQSTPKPKKPKLVTVDFSVNKRGQAQGAKHV